MKHGMVQYTPRRRVVMPVLATILLVLGLIATPAGMVSQWASSQVLDNRNFSSQLAPLATEPAVTEFVTSRATTAITAHLDPGTLANTLASQLPGWMPETMTRQLQDSADALATRIENSAAAAVDQAVHSPAFAAEWERAIKVSHEETLRMLRDPGPTPVATTGTLSMDPGFLLEQVKEQLDIANTPIASFIPMPAGHVTVLEYSLPQSAAAWVAIIDGTEDWLMWAGIGLLGLAMLLYPALLARALGLLAVVLAVGGALRHVAGLRVGDWARRNDLDPDLVQLALLRMTDSLYQQFLVASLGAAALAVVAALFRSVAAGHRRMVAALLLGLVLASGLVLLLAASLPLGGVLLTAVGAAMGVVLVEMRNARPHRKTGAAGR